MVAKIYHSEICKRTRLEKVFHKEKTRWSLEKISFSVVHFLVTTGKTVFLPWLKFSRSRNKNPRDCEEIQSKLWKLQITRKVIDTAWKYPQNTKKSTWTGGKWSDRVHTGTAWFNPGYALECSHFPAVWSQQFSVLFVLERNVHMYLSCQVQHSLCFSRPLLYCTAHRQHGPWVVFSISFKRSGRRIYIRFPSHIFIYFSMWLWIHLRWSSLTIND